MVLQPRATYRLQLTPSFGFDAVAALTPYLARLGVSHVYLSPYLQATPGSTHGYDVVDHSRVSDDLGGPAAHARMVAALSAHGLRQVIDVVPNHMAITGPENEWWWDVLRQGRASPFADHFDVDWDPPDRKLRNTVLMPILGDHYGRVLERGEIRVSGSGDDAVVRYADHVLPLAPGSLDAAVFEVDAVNADPDRLHALLERQHYRLAFWRTGTEELDYRRFFDVTTLAALRVEDDEVFNQVHWLPLAWVGDGSAGGLRIDHVDGLRDPAGYLRHLAERAPGAWIVVEKILEAGERLPESWPVAGATGYDFLNQLDGLFVDPAGEAVFDALYRELTGETAPFDEVAREGKRQVLGESLASDLRRLTYLLAAICEGDRRHRDYTRSELRDVLTELLVSFPVYRTYVVPGEQASAHDVTVVGRAVEQARARRPDLDAELVVWVGDLLLGRVAGEGPAELAARFQQLSGPVMAKGVEDTAFYRYVRFAALNEVGGDPGRFGRGVAAFHDRAAAGGWGMLTTSTHDTKRSDDVRARLLVLSQIPDRWAATMQAWVAANEPYRSGGRPDRATEYLLYQTLVGAWPLSPERAAAYMEKAAREAKVHTSWLVPDHDYEAALQQFVKAVLADDRFVASLHEFVASVVDAGRVTSLAATLVKHTAPGVPDTYQGSELWDLSLVDPDNRRPVDFEVRAALLAEVESMTAADAWAHRDEGVVKLFVVQRALGVRRHHPDLLAPAAPYVPLDAGDDALAFVRAGALATVVPRFATRPVTGTVDLPPGEWVDALTGSRVAGGPQPVASLLSGFPVALLVRESSRP
ncbi:MAG TPA: malto-oligosyltrehalose synthase [Acidimicrobiales bacterium]|nr:malto-oligosyltrehalose synthase [Acidimicrobiales bacterium]